MCAQGVGAVSRRGRSREQDSEQERTWERARGRAVATYGCGRDCDRDRGCHCDCVCDRAHDRARCAGVTCGLLGSARHRTIRHRARPHLLKGSDTSLALPFPFGGRCAGKRAGRTGWWPAVHRLKACRPGCSRAGGLTAGTPASSRVRRMEAGRPGGSGAGSTATGTPGTRRLPGTRRRPLIHTRARMSRHAYRSTHIGAVVSRADWVGTLQVAISSSPCRRGFSELGTSSICLA